MYNDDYQTTPSEQSTLYTYEQPKLKNRKPRPWGYIWTALISVLLSVSLTYLLTPSIQRGKISYTPSNTEGVFEQYTRTEGKDLSVADIAQKNGPCVVGVNIKAQSQNWFGSTYETAGSGSGIVMSADGYIVTNNHVVEGATSVSVKLYNGTEYTAKVIGKDAMTDLAVIKVEATNLQYAEFGQSSELKVGDLAVAIGNPLGQEFAGSVTVGFISALNRTVNVDGRTFNLIQTDAAINQGNSGGALINQQGQVIGINSIKISTAESMGFAIPIDIAKPILDDLIKNGYVTGRPSIGIALRQEINEQMAERYNVPAGLYIDVIPTSGADIAGMKSLDIIYKIAGEDCLTMQKCNDIKDKYKSGDTIEIEVKRKNGDKWETVKLNVTLTEEKP